MIDFIHHKNILCPKCKLKHNNDIQIKSFGGDQVEYEPGDSLPKGYPEIMITEGLGKCPQCESIYTLTTQVIEQKITSQFIVTDVKPELSAQETQKIFIDFTISKVCEKLVLEPDELKLQTRKQEIVFGRQLVWWIVRKKYGRNISIAKLAAIFVFPDHATVMHGFRKFKNILSSPGDKELASIIKDLEEEILK